MAVLTLQPAEASGIDTYIHTESTNFNHGVSTVLKVGAGGSGGNHSHRSLLKFDLSSMPAGATITSAVLTLFCESELVTTDITLFAHRMLLAFFEGPFDGVPSGGVDCSNWTYRNLNGLVAWATPGGQAGTDYATTEVGSVSITAPATAFNITVTADVVAWYTAAAANHGWMLRTDSITSNTVKTFTSSGGATAANRPKLVITYTPGIAAIAGSTAGTSTAEGFITLAGQKTLVLQPDSSTGKDTEITNNAPTFNWGARDDFHVGLSGGLDWKALIQFDLSSLPSNAVIVSAVMRLFCTTEQSASDESVSVRRGLVAWFEGNQNGAAPGAGVDGSTWNHKNANGSVAWGTAGGLAGTDYEASPTVSVSITTPNVFYNFNVAIDVTGFANGTWTNFGWWLLRGGSVANGRKFFASSENAIATNRPQLIIVYTLNTAKGTTAGTSTVTGRLTAKGKLSGLTAGTSTVTATIISNENLRGIAVGSCTVTGFLRAIWRMKGNSFGDSTAIGDMIANQPIFGFTTGTSTAVADIKGVFRMQGLASGLGTAIARLSLKGQMRGAAFGTSTAIATGYARAINVALVIGCNPVPLLHITDGSVKSNGQLNILDFLNERAGYLLINYKPQIAQYKDNGYWSSSPQSQGRRLRGKVFDNVIDMIEVAARAGSQDALIQYQQDLLDFQEAASDYWASDHAFLPFYLVARAARETNTRYAVIHMISCPELENPYTQPFFDDAVGATFTSLMIRIEHGLWMSTPPGKFDCVEVSGQREWTVSGWQVGS